MVVDAVYGILPNSIDISKRDYLSKTTAYPGHLFLGKPIIGSTSNRIMIPGGMGGVDHDGKYIGTLTIGFDIKYLIEKFQNLMRTSKVSFAIIDDNYEIVLESSRFATDHGKYKDSAKKTMEKLIRKINFEDEDTKNYAKFDFLGSVENYYLYKMPGMPYILYLYHNQAEMQKSFWQAITSRLIEIASIGIVATALIVFIYKRESQLRQQAEEASEIAKAASQAKSEFLAYTAHEIRTPLSYVITAAEIMKTQLFGPISDKYKEYAVNIYQNGAELLEFLDDLLDKSQVEKGNFKINNQIIDVRAIIDKIVSQCQARAKAHNIFLETECDQNLPNLIADPRRIAQIISNLINNSISYSPENTVVKVKVENKQDDLQFTIEDSGFGMKREDIEIALSEYGTIKNQNSSKVKSFGLGLPLVKSLVEAHGAEFIIDSTVNVGTKVIIIFGPTRLYRAMGM
jgi:signal transduction histidine kinase